MTSLEDCHQVLVSAAFSIVLKLSENWRDNQTE